MSRRSLPRGPTRAARRGEREGGQIVITFAITMALYLFGMIALVINVSAMYAARAAAEQAAQDGAVAGASDVNLAAFLEGNGVQINAAANGSGGVCAKAGDSDIASYKAFIQTGSVPFVNCTILANQFEIKAVATMTVAFPVPLPGFGSSQVGATYIAAAQSGTDKPAGN